MKKVLSLVLIVSLFSFSNFLLFEAFESRAAANSDGAYVGITIGSTISISSPSDLTLPTITGTGDSGITGVGLNASTTWNIDTNNSAGYKLEWTATGTDMISGASDTIGRYTPAVSDTPEVWSVAAADSEWGARLSASSTDTDTGVWGTIDEVEASALWLNASTTIRQIVTRNTETISPGSDEIIYFRVEVGANKEQPNGNYQVGMTMTATTL